MKSIIVGTAGHIDHGKTALIKALTGIDADRLEEEKRRGITIDIGFAHLDLAAANGETVRIGFIDVPGHERFVRNMLAGIGGIDLVLLVIAADESIKPQTREHFDICRLLSVRRGITVLTKSDLVDKETLDVVRLEVEEFVRGSFLEAPKSPIVAVSSKTGAGLEVLKQQLGKLALDAAGRDSRTFPRLPIDRVFTMKGFGTVVTGTLISGTIRKEDELEIFPEHKKARVRGIHVHGQPVNEAAAGQRIAVNLAGVSVEELKRGMVLSSPATFRPTKRLDVSLSLLASAKPLKQRSRLHFHSYTMESIAEVFLYEAKQLAPGEEAFAQLRLADSTLLLPGDRFIIRQFSPVVTIGGGVVLDAFPLRKQPEQAILEFLREMESTDPACVLKARVARQGTHGLMLQQAIEETGWSEAVIDRCMQRDGEVQKLGNVLITKQAFGEVLRRIQATLAQFHEQNPLVAGMSMETLRSGVATSNFIFDFAIDSLLRAQRIVSTAGLIRLPGRGVLMKDEETESKNIIETAFASAGLKVPALKDVLTGLKVDRVRAQKIVTLLLREKILVKISDDLVFHSSALENLRKSLAEEKKKSSKIDVARFKDLAGVSRKYAIPLLEYLDREHVTRRAGDERLIL